MLYQRLNPKSSLRDAVLHFKETAPDELKTTEEMRAQSNEMFLKDFALSMVAYNLTTVLPDYLRPAHRPDQGGAFPRRYRCDRW